MFATLSSRRIRSWLIVGILAGLSAAPLSSALAQSRNSFTIVETGEGYKRLQDAVDAVGGASGTIAIGPGIYRQCAIQEAGSIRYRAQQAGTVIFDGKSCEGKAALVLRGNNAEVAGLIFRNMSVSDGNGAGIRLEKGNLTVTQSWFADSQQGILAGTNRASQIVIDKVTFSGLGTCEYSGGCAHSIYIGDLGYLKVTRSRFERGAGGHYAKSRAARNDFFGNSFDDANGRGTNYMIDLPAGGIGEIRDNWFVQGRDKENYSAFIAVAAEQQLHSSNGLKVAGNVARFVPGLKRNSVFVANWSRDRIDIGGNEIAPGIETYQER